MCDVAFSSKSVFRNVSLCGPPRVAVDERDLAESPRAFVGLDLLADDLLAARRLTPTISPPSKRSSRSRTIVPWRTSGIVERTVPSARRRSGVVNASSVGRFGTCVWPQAVFASAATHCERAVRPIVRSVPGPRKWIASKRAFVERARSRLEHLDVVSPGRDGVGLVEAHGRGDGLPQPLDVRLAEHRLRPALVRAADDRPRDRPLAEQLEVARPEAVIRALPTRCWSRSAKRSGSASPTSRRIAPFRSASSSSRETSHGGVQSSASSGPCSICARFTRGSLM